MSELLFSSFLILMAVVITREEILEEISVGTHRDEVESYFEELTEDERIRYFTRDDSREGTVSHDLQGGEKGYYVVELRNVRENWWWPSFGAHLIVLVIISDNDTVAEVKFVGGRTGWP